MYEKKINFLKNAFQAKQYYKINVKNYALYTLYYKNNKIMFIDMG